MDSLKIKSSDLDREIVLMQPVTGAKDRFNVDTVTYTDYCIVAAAKEEAGAKQFYAAEKLQNEKRLRMKIRQPDVPIDVTWRFRYPATTTGDVYEIHDVQEIGRGRGYLLNGFKNIT